MSRDENLKKRNSKNKEYTDETSYNEIKISYLQIAKFANSKNIFALFPKSAIYFAYFTN